MGFRKIFVIGDFGFVLTHAAIGIFVLAHAHLMLKQHLGPVYCRYAYLAGLTHALLQQRHLGLVCHMAVTMHHGRVLCNFLLSRLP